MSLWTMKEVIQITGTTENALRYYNTKGVLPPTVKESTGRRQWLYDDVAIERLKKLFLLKYIGISIEEAGELLNCEKKYRDVIMKTLEQLKKERDKIDHQIFIAQTLAVSYGIDIFDSDEEMDEAKASVLNEIIRELIQNNAEEERR